MFIRQAKQSILITNIFIIKNKSINSQIRYVHYSQNRHLEAMSIPWTQKVALFSQHGICRENYFYAARASSSTCCGVL